MGGRRRHTGFFWENLRKGDHFEDIGVNGKIILKWILKKRDGETDWIALAQDRDRRRALLNAVINLLISIKAGDFLTR
jgi:hypothetical protein